MRRSRTLFAVLLSFSLLAAACGGDDDSSTPTTTAPAKQSVLTTTTAAPATTAAPSGLDELNVAYFLEWPTANQVAQVEQTYDSVLGLTVNWIAFPSGNDMALAMESGDIDISYSQGLTPFANYVTSGADHVIVGVAVSYADADNCVAHPDYAVSQDNAASSLAGQAIYTPIGNVTHFKLLKMLEHLGVSLDDVSLIPSEGGPAAVAAFENGDVAMACAFGGAINTMLASGGNLVMTGSEQEALGIRVFDIISAPRSFAEEHGDVVTAFLQVTEDANAAYAADRASLETTIADAAGMDLAGTSSLLDAFTFLDSDSQLSEAWLGGTVQAAMKEQMDFFVAQGEIDTALDSYDGVVDTSYLEAVVGRGFGAANPQATSDVDVVACGLDEVDGDLNFYNWSEYMDPDLITAFQDQYGVTVTEDFYPSNEEMFARVEAGGSGYDMVIPSDYMVSILISESMILAVPGAAVPNKGNIADTFSNPPYDPGALYTAAYQWGTTGIGVDIGVTGEVPHTWGLLFDADLAEQYGLSGKITILDDPRETMGAALKYLGYSLNSTSESELAEAEAIIADAVSRVAAFDSDQYDELIVTGESVVGHGYSGNFLWGFEEGDSEYDYFVPDEGGTIWVDNMAVLADAPHPCTAFTFMNFLLDAENGAQLTNYNWYASPNGASQEEGLIDAEVLENPIIYPTDMSLLEFIEDTGDFEINFTDALSRARS